MAIVHQTQGSASRRGILSRLRRDRSGAVLMEFAFVAGPFIALLLASLQTALIFFGDQLIETATQEASRAILTGEAQKNGMTQAQFKAMACTKLPNFMSCNDLSVDVVKVNSWSTAPTGSPTITYSGGTPTLPNRYTLGGPSDIVMVRLMYPWNVVGAEGLNLASMQNGQYLMIGTTVTRTEPY